MSDLISRQAAIDALNGEINITGRANAEAVRGYVRLVKDRLDRLPSAQPEIIRCKDCKHRNDIEFSNGTLHLCERFDKTAAHRIDDLERFCSSAERKEE